MERGIGLALSGGGVSGASHVGVLLALDEAGIPIDYIAGTSSGAIVAALFACGISPQEMAQRFPKVTRSVLDWDFKSMWQLFFPRTRRRVNGLIEGQAFVQLLQNLLGETPLHQASVPVAICVTDLTHGEEVIFSSHPLRHVPEGSVEVREGRFSDAVRASLSIPFLFKPVELSGRSLVDGSIVDNCPILPVRSLGAEQVLAVDVVMPYTTRPRPPQGLLDIYGKVINLMLARQTTAQRSWAEYVLCPDVGNVGVMDFDKVSSCIEKGYAYTKERIPQIIEAFSASPQAEKIFTEGVQISPPQQMRILRRQVKASQ